MSRTEITLDGAASKDFLHPDAHISHPTSEDAIDVAIAPWFSQDDPPTPPPKPSRPFGFPKKSSFVSFGQQSTTSLLTQRPSESHSIAESSTSGSASMPIDLTPRNSSARTSISTNNNNTTGGNTGTSPTTSKAKTSLNVFSTLLKKSRSRTRLRSDATDQRNGNGSTPEAMLDYPYGNATALPSVASYTTTNASYIRYSDPSSSRSGTGGVYRSRSQLHLHSHSQQSLLAVPDGNASMNGSVISIPWVSGGGGGPPSPVLMVSRGGGSLSSGGISPGAGAGEGVGGTNSSGGGGGSRSRIIRNKKKSFNRSSALPAPSTLPSSAKDPQGHDHSGHHREHFHLDTNLDSMDGIIDLTMLPSAGGVGGGLGAVGVGGVAGVGGMNGYHDGGGVGGAGMNGHGGVGGFHNGRGHRGHGHQYSSSGSGSGSTTHSHSNSQSYSNSNSHSQSFSQTQPYSYPHSNNSHPSHGHGYLNRELSSSPTSNDPHNTNTNSQSRSMIKNHNNMTGVPSSPTSPGGTTSNGFFSNPFVSGSGSSNGHSGGGNSKKQRLLESHVGPKTRLGPAPRGFVGGVSAGIGGGFELGVGGGLTVGGLGVGVGGSAVGGVGGLGGIGMGGADWTAPESWAVEKEGEDVEGYSSSDDSEGEPMGMGNSANNINNTMAGGAGGSGMSIMSKRKSKRKQVTSISGISGALGGNQHPTHPSSHTPHSPHIHPSSSQPNLYPHPHPHPRSSSRAIQSFSPRAPYKSYKIRIYRANNTYHVASIALTVTVGELTPVLNQKLLLDNVREVHRLYLKERGRERVLAQTERPADIVRRRLEQAGYDVADGLESLGVEDLTFLLKFVYKSQLLGPAEEDLPFDDFEFIDLTGRSLRTVPVVLHAHADTIVSLNLSRNPMLEIPLDFIQSCTTLRELRLSNMAMKKVPQSVRHSITLHRLDLSCNRIVDLDDAGLDRIPDLTTLNVQNNRMEKLPWYFPRLRTLKFLNISNNKFRQIPAVVAEMVSLVDLDISFNMISELPEEIGQLRALERLIIVGNGVTRFPDQCATLKSLREVDCRRNLITDLSVICMLPKLERIRADRNAVHALDLSVGPCLTTLDVSRNDITQLTLMPGPEGSTPCALTSLDISHAKLLSLDGFELGQLSSLQTLRMDYNSIHAIPESLGDLSRLVTLSCSDNDLVTLPASIGRLQKLETLDVHNNGLTELPVNIWNCASLMHINVTSNVLGVWHPPPPTRKPSADVAPAVPTGRVLQVVPERKSSMTGSIASKAGRTLPPLAHSLERLYIGENRLTGEVLDPLTILKELRVLNLSFNDIQDLPPTFFKNLTQLEEIYLSGNQLSSIPTEDLNRLTRLSILFLNGNRLQTLPQELGKLQNLAMLDVGSNVLKYNINNWEFDWNWNFNPNLKYLNLSGNKRLEIKPDTTTHKMQLVKDNRKILADFSSMNQLRVLGLMDVTTTFVSNIPDESDDRRVRTSQSDVNNMAYGIADSMGKNEHLTTLDLVQPEFRERKNEAIFAMFGRAMPFASNNGLTKFLHDNFLGVFSTELAKLDHERNEGAPDALRRSFLRLNKLLYEQLTATAASSRKMSQASASTTGRSGRDTSLTKCGASGIVLYFLEKTMYVANAGNMLAVISRQGVAEVVSKSHDPWSETSRIRTAEGWVSPKGLVNDEIDISRSFGFYHLLPVVNARPDIWTWQLEELDEFVIMGNRGLWDYVSYQTAVDIARSERADPMIAAQKLRDFAISYGAEGTTMIMVICVADLFNNGSLSRSRQPTMDSLVDSEAFASTSKRRRKDDIADRKVARLEGEVSPPIGHIALVFTDIRNSTRLWETKKGMSAAIRVHNSLLRRQLRFCGGYEVKTEGDAFICSFRTTISALWWALTVQIQLLHEDWPLDILESEDGKEVLDSQGKLVARGLSVRMGIHCGSPYCEPDPITHRMDYFGPMVNRSARISGCAGGGQIMCSAAVIREINAKILETEPETEWSLYQPQQAINAVKRIGVVVVPFGEVKLKGLEVPEMLSLVYPSDMEGRHDLDDAVAPPSASQSRVQFSVEQMQELALLCLRVEALASSRIFRPLPERKKSVRKLSLETESNEDRPDSLYMYGDPSVLLPSMSDTVSDAELMVVLDSLSIRIDNALGALDRAQLAKRNNSVASIVSALEEHQGLDERTLGQILALLRGG